MFMEPVENLFASLADLISVRFLGFGIRPFGPRSLANGTKAGIISGVAKSTSKSITPFFIVFFVFLLVFFFLVLGKNPFGRKGWGNEKKGATYQGEKKKNRKFASK